jgi:Putative prokaryotic signal transducing protein
VSGRDGSTVPVAVAHSQFEADLIVGLLQSAGIRAFALADDAGGQEPQWQLSSGVRVMVEPSDESAAREVLADARGRDGSADEELR